jgi:hypothetical protein
MFKKSLFAISLAAASTAAFAASTVVNYPGGYTAATPSVGSDALPTISAEGFAALTANKYFTPGAVVYNISSADAAAVSQASVTLTGAEFANTDAVFTFYYQSGASETGTPSSATLTKTWTFGDLNSVKLTGFPTFSATSWPRIVMTSADLVPTDTAADALSKVTFSMDSILKPIDSATATLAKFVNQFSLVVLDTFGEDGEQIDVQSNSRSLTTANDAFSFAAKSLQVDYHSYTSAVSVAGNLTGDFSWALDGSGAYSAGLGTLGNFTISSVAQSVDAAFTPANVSTSYGLTAQPSTSIGTGTLQPGSYEAKLGVYSSNGKKTFVAAKDYELGSWSLNGSELTVPYMPFGSAYAQAISITNGGSIGGEITVSFTANGETTDPITVGTSAPKTVVNIGKDVADAAIAAGLKEAQVNIIVKAPSADVKATAIYYAKADQDRVNVTAN